MSIQVFSEKTYAIKLNEVVIDRHGGRIKWARDPLALEMTDDRRVRIVSLIMRPLSLYLYTDHECPGCA